jgi:ABC-type enterochelin transport system substrate-binding protein
MKMSSALLLGALVLALGACSGQSEPTTESDKVAASDAPSGFPLTLPQKGGSVTLDRQPERVSVVDN